MNEVLAVILGGGAGTRLFPLTRDRAKPAVPLAGKYRLVDVPISNCLNSDVDRIFVVTQFNSASLNRHVARSYVFDRFSGGDCTGDRHHSCRRRRHIVPHSDERCRGDDGRHDHGHRWDGYEPVADHVDT